MKSPTPATWHDARRDLERAVFEAPGLRSCTLRIDPPDAEGHDKTVLRRIALRDSVAWQVTHTGAPAAHTETLSLRQARTLFRERFALATALHLVGEQVDLHARRTRKGRILTARGKPSERSQEAVAPHDRVKDYPLTRIESAQLLRVLGFTDEQDRPRPSMQAKYRQVNEFLRVLDAALPPSETVSGRPLSVIDLGCGKAYLAFAARHYLAQSRRRPVHLTAVDRRDDLITACRETAERLGLAPPEAAFECADISDVRPAGAPDVVLSLHACDDATDAALAQAVAWDAAVVLCAPCCQHQIQQHLRPEGAQRALLRHGILKERLADLLADALRAQLLRLCGYRVRVIEFVDPEATGRNLLLRAERSVRPGNSDALAEYLDLRDAWGVRPPLERLLAPRLPELPSP